jgi:hypothetical protein
VDRTPNPAIGGVLRPDSVVIQILIAHSSGCDVASRKGSVETFVANCAPAIEAVICRGFCHLVGQRRFIGKADLLVRVDAHARTFASRVSLTFPNRDHCSVAVRIDVKTIVT